MTGRNHRRTDRGQPQKRDLPEPRALELQVLELLIASGAGFDELLVYWAQRLTAQELTK
jgi:hypothetical protein